MDYTLPGAYFVTARTQQRGHVLADVHGTEFVLSRAGHIVRDTLLELPKVFFDLELDQWEIMPDHVHILLWLHWNGITPPPGIRVPSLSEVVGRFKALSAKRIRREQGTAGGRFWQRGYYDRCIRDEADLEFTRGYIRHNRQAWLNEHCP